MKIGSDLVRHGAIVLTGTLGANVLGYVFHVAMSRQLGVAGYGSMLGLFSLFTIVSIPALVAQTVVAKTVADYVGAQRLDRIRRYVRVVVPSAAAIGIATAAALSFARSELATFLNTQNSSGVLIVAWAIAFYLVLPILNGILQGDQRFRALAVSVVSDALIRAVLAISLVAHGFGVNGALLAIAIGVTVATGLAVTFVADFLGAPTRRLEPSGRDMTLLASLRLSGGILVITILASVDVLLVKHFRTSYEAGLFGSLALIGRIVYLFSSFVPTIVLPKATARINEGLSPVPLLVQAIVVFAIALGTVLVPLLVAPGLILRIVVGSAYASAAPLLALYGSAIGFLAAAYAAANYNIGVNRLGFVLPVTIIGFAEVGLIALYHGTLVTIVQILAGGHFLIFIATVFRMWKYDGIDNKAVVGAGLV